MVQDNGIAPLAIGGNLGSVQLRQGNDYRAPHTARIHKEPVKVQVYPASIVGIIADRVPSPVEKFRVPEVERQQ